MWWSGIEKEYSKPVTCKHCCPRESIKDFGKGVTTGGESMVKEWKRSTVVEDSNEGCRKWKVIVWERMDGFVLARKAGPAG
jgi:hypothetical protein